MQEIFSKLFSSKINLGTYDGGDQAVKPKKDLRKQVSNTLLHPYKGIGRVECKFDSFMQNLRENNSFGTGALIGPNLVLTSAHVISYQQTGEIAKQIMFYPQPYKNGQNGVKAIRQYIHFKYFDKTIDNCQYYDAALLILENSNLVSPQNVLSIQWNFDYNTLKDTNILISGYPVDLVSKKRAQYYEENVALEQQKPFIFYQHCTTKGNSGGPLLFKKKTNEKQPYKIIGIHKGAMPHHKYGLETNTSTMMEFIFQSLVEQIDTLRKQNLQFIPANTDLGPQRMKILEGMLKKKEEQIVQIKTEIQKLRKTLTPPQPNPIIPVQYLINVFKEQCQKRLNKNPKSKLYSLNHSLSKIQMNIFVSYDWKNLEAIKLEYTQIGDQEWKIFVDHSELFPNTSEIYLKGNNIRTVNDGDIEKFKSIIFIDFGKKNESNPLSVKTKEYIKKYLLRNPQHTILYES